MTTQGSQVSPDEAYLNLHRRIPGEPEPAFEDPAMLEKVWGRKWGLDNDVGRLRTMGIQLAAAIDKVFPPPEGRTTRWIRRFVRIDVRHFRLPSLFEDDHISTSGAIEGQPHPGPQAYYYLPGLPVGWRPSSHLMYRS